MVAPGTWVLSGYSSEYQEGYSGTVNPQNGAYQYDGWGFPYSTFYKYMGGTSMSAPITSGSAAVVRDFYDKADGHEASAALTKATLINSADDLLDENNDGVDDNDYPIPNNHEGWGIIDVAEATDGDHVYSDRVPVNTSETVSYDVTAPGGTELKVTVVWTDYPSTDAAAVNLVNDIDLTVTAPGGGTEYLGNVFSGGMVLSRRLGRQPQQCGERLRPERGRRDVDGRGLRDQHPSGPAAVCHRHPWCDVQRRHTAGVAGRRPAQSDRRNWYHCDRRLVGQSGHR